MVCLEVVRPLKTSSDDVESKRGEDRDWKSTLLLLVGQESKELDKLVDCFNCWCAQSVVSLGEV
jgi:hypothetical protein